MHPHSIYPCADLIVTDLRQSMRAARITALRATRRAPDRAHALPAMELASLTASLERIISLLEVDK
jgi:hypothetical protein